MTGIEALFAAIPVSDLPVHTAPDGNRIALVEISG